MTWRVLAAVLLVSCASAPPAPSSPPAAAPTSSLAALQQVKSALGPFRAGLKARGAVLGPELAPLVAQIGERQRTGKNVSCSYQIYRELRWRLNFTSDEAAIRSRLRDLEKSLASSDDQAFATAQVPEDGSWGACYQEWFMRAWASVERLQDLTPAEGSPRFPLKFVDRINSPELITEYLRSIRTTDVAKTGEFTRVRADDSVSALGRLLLDGVVPSDVHFHGDVQGAYLRFLDDEWQNPETGMWGIWFALPDGSLAKTDDTGITFHILSQRHGQVRHLDRIASGMLALKSIDFPFGWRVNGHYENHLSWDTAKIFRYAWPSSTDTERAAMAAEIQAMLDWCLQHTLTEAGEFKVSDLDDTPGDAAENGIWFLREVGYFDRSRRFWTTADFPGAEELKRKLGEHLKATGLADPAFKRAYGLLAE